jgi:hypothetical protein
MTVTASLADCQIYSGEWSLAFGKQFVSVCFDIRHAEAPYVIPVRLCHIFTGLDRWKRCNRLTD